jgi:hypothetical protein
MNKFLITILPALFSLNVLANSYDTINSAATDEIMSSISVGTQTGSDFGSTNKTTTTDQTLREKLWDKDTAGMISAISNKSDRGGLTLLMIAAAFGDTSTVRYLINADKSVADDTLIKIAGINKDKVKDKDFYEATKYFVEQQQQNGVFIRATSDYGYTALTYAVVGGHYDVVVYLMENLKEKLGKAEVTKLINKKDNNLWTAILYSTSFSSDADDKEDLTRLNILKYLALNGADTKVKGKNFYEGELDLISIAAKYAHAEIVKYFRITYKDLYAASNYTGIEKAFGTNKEIQSSISTALKVALKYQEANKSDKTLYAKYGQVIGQLSAWDKSFSYTEAYSHYRLTAGGSNLDDPYGVYNLKLSYTIDGTGVVNDVTISDSPITKGVKNKDKFKFTYAVKYFNKPMIGADADDLPDYEPASAKEAYVFITWSYSNDRPIEPSFFGPEEGNYTDRDSGISVIYIDASVATIPKSEVVKAGGYWLYDAEDSGLTKITE